MLNLFQAEMFSIPSRFKQMTQQTLQPENFGTIFSNRIIRMEKRKFKLLIFIYLNGTPKWYYSSLHVSSSLFPFYLSLWIPLLSELNGSPFIDGVVKQGFCDEFSLLEWDAISLPSIIDTRFTQALDSSQGRTHQSFIISLTDAMRKPLSDIVNIYYWKIIELFFRTW